MKRIIDIPDEMYDDIKHGYICSEYADTLIQLIPSSKPYEERPQGKWIKDEEHSITINMFKCSNCNGGGYPHFKYCPHCGAEMRGKEDMKSNKKETTFDDYLKEQLKDPEFRKEWEKLCDEDMQKGDKK